MLLIVVHLSPSNLVSDPLLVPTQVFPSLSTFTDCITLSVIPEFSRLKQCHSSPEKLYNPFCVPIHCIPSSPTAIDKITFSFNPELVALKTFQLLTSNLAMPPPSVPIHKTLFSSDDN